MAPRADDGPPPLRRVLVVDAHRTVAELLALALDAQDDLECVGTAADADEVVHMVTDLEPDVVVVDLGMPRCDGLAVARRIRERRDRTGVILVTAHHDPEWRLRATLAGVADVLPRDGSLTELLDAVRRARPGRALAPVVEPRELPDPLPRPRATPDATIGAAEAVRLTTREQDVLGYLGTGMPPKAIARVLGISVHTCRGYVKAVLTKLDAGSQLEAVVIAQRLGMVPAQR